jgi:hypothetical protein
MHISFSRAAGSKDAPEPPDPITKAAKPLNSSHIEKSLLASYPGVPTVLDDSQAWPMVASYRLGIEK